VAKVKKRTGLTGVRNVKGSNAKSPDAGTRKLAATVTRPASSGRRAGKRTSPKASSVSSKAKAASAMRKPPPARVVIRELDPRRLCGGGTSVQFLYRVDEILERSSSKHLVFFDRHGWYCEHGRTCPAVAHARRHKRAYRASLLKRPRTELTTKRQDERT